MTQRYRKKPLEMFGEFACTNEMLGLYDTTAIDNTLAEIADETDA